jgi:DNA-binding transcriptional MerR regulator
MYIEKYLIHELAERAQTTIRTIRYYTDEGLLPQPDMQGKYAYYNRSHLNRLELIRRLKEAYLPLREIKQIINSLNDAEVILRLEEKQAVAPGGKLENSVAPTATGSDAIDYIAKLMQEQSRHRPGNIPAPQPSTPPQPLASPPPVAGPTVPTGEMWRRIAITPGLELAVREQHDPSQSIKIDQLILFAKNLFR